MVIASSIPRRLRGLIGRDDFSDVMLLVPCNDIHTFGMRCEIDVAFVAADGTVLKAQRSVGRRRRIRCRAAVATLERISNPAPWLEQGDQVEIERCLKGARNAT